MGCGLRMFLCLVAALVVRVVAVTVAPPLALRLHNNKTGQTHRRQNQGVGWGAWAPLPDFKTYAFGPLPDSKIYAFSPPPPPPRFPH